MLNTAKRVTLEISRSLGVYHRAASSRWRRERLMILCYHSVALEREHEWRPTLFFRAEALARRFELLRRGGYNVLPLGEAVERLYAGDLPEKSGVITFDDGTYDFHSLAYPMLREFGFPATVYLTSYYASKGVPVFPVFVDYLLWKQEGRTVPADRLLGAGASLDLRTPGSRAAAVRGLVEYADREGMTAPERDDFARSLATMLGDDADALWGKRVLQIMSPEEVAEVARGGVDVQLHTHRHRSPVDEALYRREIRENREAIVGMTGVEPRHFCYPSGAYRPEFVEWLAGEGVVSATTTERGIATRASHPLLLPRLVDTSAVPEVEFEGWLAGAAALVPRRQWNRARFDAVRHLRAAPPSAAAPRPAEVIRD
jgi:peptidoglycan/xylan/chitin deacetylase (PgdA/CDA1 family)